MRAFRLVLCAALIATAMLFACSGCSKKSPKDAEASSSSEGFAGQVSDTQIPSDVDLNTPAGRAAARGLPAPPAVDPDSWELILANDTHSIGEYAPPELVSIEGQEFDARIGDALNDMVADARAQGLSVYLSSGYRGYFDQQYLYERKKEQYPPEGKTSDGRYIVLPPGTSEHQTGLCCDITDQYYEMKGRDLENTAMYQYLVEHCQEYGFILRYPDGREAVTGVIYEPWHFRYVGLRVASYIMQNDLTLEEFLQLYGIE